MQEKFVPEKFGEKKLEREKFVREILYSFF